MEIIHFMVKSTEAGIVGTVIRFHCQPGVNMSGMPQLVPRDEDVSMKVRLLSSSHHSPRKLNDLPFFLSCTNRRPKHSAIAKILALRLNPTKQRFVLQINPWPSEPYLMQCPLEIAWLCSEPRDTHKPRGWHERRRATKADHRQHGENRERVHWSQRFSLLQQHQVASERRKIHQVRYVFTFPVSCLHPLWSVLVPLYFL